MRPLLAVDRPRPFTLVRMLFVGLAATTACKHEAAPATGTPPVDAGAAHTPDSSPSVATSASAAPSATAADAQADLIGQVTAPPLRQVYLVINGVKLINPARPKLRVHVTADINSARLDYPSGKADHPNPATGTLKFVEVTPDMKAERFPLARAFSYEIYFAMSIEGREQLFGNAETVDASGGGGEPSGKLPYDEDYKLYFMVHNTKASTPSAILSFSLTDKPPTAK